MFEYTGKKIGMIDAYKEEILNEFARIKKLTFSLSPWVEKMKTDKIWICEYVDKLKGIGKHGEAKMNEMNIHTIANLQRYVQSYGFPMLQIRGFGRIYEHRLEYLPGKPTPSTKYHRKAKIPCFLRYGERWVEKLQSSSSMSKFCCITDLIRFMMKEAEKMMKGSVHEDHLFIVHHALVLMTSKDKITWMKENN